MVDPGSDADLLLRALFDGSPDVLVLVDRSDRVVRVNRTLFGEVPAADGQPLRACLGADLGAAADLLAASVRKSGKPRAREIAVGGPDGEPRVYELRSTPVGGGAILLRCADVTARRGLELALEKERNEGEPSRDSLVDADTGQHRRWEDELRASEARYRVLFHASPIPTWVYDQETLRFLAVNDAATARYGYSKREFLGLTLADIRPPEEVTRLLEPIPRTADEVTLPLAWKHRARDGSVFEVEITGHSLTFNGRAARLVVARDLTEQRRVEQRLFQSQKMDAIGRLAGGVAHDLNNMLAVILVNVDVMLEALPKDDPLREDLDSAREAAKRAASLTSQLLAFSRRQILQPRIVALNTVLLEMEPILERVINEDVSLQWRLDPDLGRVRADPTQIEQVVMSLAINARDAMPKGGELHIGTRNAVLSAADVVAELPPGSYVVLSVRDTGTGMPPATVARIFEPFFTTKPQGRGTGLGLSTVFGTVAQSGGAITVASTLGEGTLFEIYLPHLEGAGQPSKYPSRPGWRLGTSETILLVEDDPHVRASGAKLLSGLGYAVVQAESGTEAVALCREHAEAFDLVLTDLVMPGIDGVTTAAQIAELHPTARFLFSSGYAEHEVFSSMDPNARFLPKPYTVDQLARAVRDALAAPVPGG